MFNNFLTEVKKDGFDESAETFDTTFFALVKIVVIYLKLCAKLSSWNSPSTSFKNIISDTHVA